MYRDCVHPPAHRSDARLDTHEGDVPTACVVPCESSCDRDPMPDGRGLHGGHLRAGTAL